MNDAVAAAPVTVIVVNFNAGDHLRRCLAHLAEQSQLPEQILIMDNGSTDGSLAAGRHAIQSDPRLADRTVIHELGANIGFAAACNQGIAAATTEFVALLNPDAFPESGWLAALVTTARAFPGCAAFGSRQMLAGRSNILDGIGDRWHLTGLSYRDGHGRALTPADLEAREIFSPCAAAALYRKHAVLAVGGFDEDYFCFGEDVDLGYRLRLAGHGARCVPDAVVDHVGGGSTPGDVATYFGHRNVVWTLVKNTPGPLLVISLLGHLCQSILVGVVLGFRGRGRAFVRGKQEAVRGLAAAFRKRRFVQSGRKVSTWTICRMIDTGMSRRRSAP
jgi:GT2 family glycosyltransferase